MKETAIWNHERMPIIDGMPASVTDGQPHTPEPWEESSIFPGIMRDCAARRFFLPCGRQIAKKW